MLSSILPIIFVLRSEIIRMLSWDGHRLSVTSLYSTHRIERIRNGNVSFFNNIFHWSGLKPKHITWHRHLAIEKLQWGDFIIGVLYPER